MSASTSRTQARTWLLPDDVEAMRAAAYSDELSPGLALRDEAIVALLYDTGLRRSEAAALDVDNLELSEGYVYVPGSIQKQRSTGVPRGSARLELGRYGADSTTPLRRYLSRRPEDVEALFPSRQSDRMTDHTLNLRVKRLAELADVRPRLVDGGRGSPEDVSSHTLRHSVAYRIIEVEGGRLEDVQMRLRHDQLVTTDRIYSHLIPR